MGTEKKSFIYQPDDTKMGRQIEVQAIPTPELGIDQNSIFLNQILDGVSGNGLNIAKIDALCSISQNRNSVYDLIDTMLEDPTIASVIDIYCEDATETNDKGQIMWVESSDDQVAQYIEYLLNDLNIEKNVYKWVSCLIKYGDVYLRLYHDSEYEKDDLLDDIQTGGKKPLNEDVVLKAYKSSDNFVHYVSMVPNPAEMFELTKFGKTYAYIQAPVTAYMDKKKDISWAFGNYTYNFKRKDVNVFTADNFVHGSLDNLSSREPEEINLSLTTDENDEIKYTYNVKRGQSILYNAYKVWRQNMLLEYALLLNRLSRSQSVKIMNVEVGDMPGNQVVAKLNAIKALFEQKTALATDVGTNEYSNSGPAENIVYVASHNGQGTITPQEITSDLNVSGLDDVELFKNKLYGALKVPRAYLGDNDETGGFDGGTSLSLISSRYAKTVKRIQNVMIQTITDLINILLVDKGFQSYINKFKLRMQEPTTREEVDRKDAQVNRITVVQDTMSLFDDIQDPVSRLSILKCLLGSVSTDSDILAILEKNIDTAKEQAEMTEGEADLTNLSPEAGGGDLGLGGMDSGLGLPNDLGGAPDMGGADMGAPDMEGADMGGGGELPTPEALGVDMVNM